VKVRQVRESLPLNAAQVDELALQCGGRQRERERERDGFNARFQIAVNLSVDFNRNSVLRLSLVSEL